MATATANLNKCAACARVLVKQLVNDDGLPLTAAEREAYETAMRYTKDLLECSVCGRACFHDRRRKAGPSADRQGLCRDCGGKDSTRVPPSPPDYERFRQMRTLPSCPVHGIAPTY